MLETTRYAVNCCVLMIVWLSMPVNLCLLSSRWQFFIHKFVTPQNLTYDFCAPSVTANHTKGESMWALIKIRSKQVTKWRVWQCCRALLTSLHAVSAASLSLCAAHWESDTTQRPRGAAARSKVVSGDSAARRRERTQPAGETTGSELTLMLKCFYCIKLWLQSAFCCERVSERGYWQYMLSASG